MEDLIAPVRAVNWGDAREMEAAGRRVLERLAAEPERVHGALDALERNEGLFTLSEHYPDVFDKVVLYADDSGIRLRLHVFLASYTENPHNHRWPFVTRILRGGYEHHIYASGGGGGQLLPRYVESVGVGSVYALHPDLVHMVVPKEANTVSLILRGPAIRDHYTVAGPEAGAAETRYGAGAESAEATLNKRMSPERLRAVRNLLDDWQLFS